jgi:hypothetical protein
MGKLGFARIHSFSGIFRLCLCFVLVGIIVLGAAERAVAAPAMGSLPVIKAFTGDPLTVPDGGHVVYTFEVYDGTKIQVIENGEIIDEFNGPPLTTSKGKANGRTTYQIRKGNMDSYDTILRARNPNGQKEQKLTILFATKSKPKPTSLIQPVSDNGTSKKNRWGPQTSAPVSLTSSSASSQGTGSPYVPGYAECPRGCNCLTPDQAAQYGFKQKCSEERCFSTDKQVNSYCYNKTAGWCCKDGKVSPATGDQCKEAGGSYWSTDQAQVIKACQPLGWFCSGSKVYQGTSSQAAQAGATWYATQAEATKACESPGCWCCTGGRYGQTTTDACAKTGGTCYATQAEASERCQPLGWFCSGSKVYQGTSSQAAQAGATWYATQAEATKACESPGCWCCTGGRYGQTTTDACAKTGGTCYATQAQASERCQPLGGCCANGNVSQTTQTQCAQVGGKWYSSVTEAQRACVPPITYYCCRNGQVYKSTTPGTGCYTSPTEAERACAPPPTTTYWCCSNGQVSQSKTLGRGCYATQAEAIKACTPIPTPIAPTPRTFVPNVK